MLALISLEKLRNADRRTLGRAITLLESTREDHRDQAEALLTQVMPFSGNALRVGISGAPGVGKSTFIDALGMHVIERGRKVAVLTIDPTSSITGGSILGDKTRMERLSHHPSAFIRPSPSGMNLGGVARRTREAILVCEAAGFDFVIVETVGVGQSETLVAEMTDLFLLLLLPGGGDDLQGIKRGIMELADMIVINKADGDLVSRANLALADVKHALNLIKPRLSGWNVPVLSASALQETGIDEIWRSIEKFDEVLSRDDLIGTRRETQSLAWLWRETGEMLLDALRKDQYILPTLNDLQSAVKAGKISPSMAARKLSQQFIAHHQ